MNKFISDFNQYEIINHAYIAIWYLFIDYWQSEPHYQNQNVSENCNEKNKCLTNTNLDFMIDDDYTCLIYLMYV